MRIGIFGGSFNPPHMGHLGSLEEVYKKAGLDAIRVIPNNESPLKIPIEGASALDRLQMTKLALASYSDHYIVDDREIVRGGKSYTIDTIKSLQKEFPEDEFFLIIGMDQFEDLSAWKDYTKIIEKANVIVTSRPGFNWGYDMEDLPNWIKPFVTDRDKTYLELNTGKHVFYVKLNDVPVSSSELRKELRTGKVQHKYLPLAVEGFIKEKSLYAPLGDKIADYEVFTQWCADILFSKKGIQVRAYNLTGLSAPSDYTLICSGTSTRHTSAMAENLVRAVKEEYGVYPLSLEGQDEGRWVLVDYGTLIVHVFYDFVRSEYALEKLWTHGKPIALVDKAEKA